MKLSDWEIGREGVMERRRKKVELSPPLRDLDPDKWWKMNGWMESELWCERWR